MEINPLGVLLAFLLFFVLGFFAAMALIAVVASLKIIRLKNPSHIVGWSILGSIILNLAFWTIKCNYNQRKTDPIQVTTAPTVVDSIRK